ncbi:MAG: hypothetical protein IJ303_01920 [Clostridia bacterium]|nr:hypothetical protein [Clostridia bacterium]
MSYARVAARSNENSFKADGGTKQTAYGAQARMYYISRKMGGRRLTRISGLS